MIRHVKHLGIIIVALIIIIVGIVPLIDGMIFKMKYHEFISIINNEYRIHADILEYHEGWFNSAAKLKITIHDDDSTLGKMMSKYTYIINAKISHGPIVYHGIENKIALGYANIHSVLHIAQSGSDVKSAGVTQLDTLAKFNGNWHCQIKIPVLSVELPNMANITWDGMIGSMIFKLKNKNIEHLVIKAQLGKLTFVSSAPNLPIKNISIQPILYQSDTVHDKMGLWSGNALFTIPNITILGQNDGAVQIENSNINSQYGLTPDVCYNSDLAVNITKFTLPSALIPQMENSHIKLAASNFKINGLIDFMLLFISDTKNAINALFNGESNHFLIQTILSNSVINADLWSKTSIGNFDSHTEITWPNDIPLPTNATELAENIQATMNLKGTYDFTINLIKFYRENIISTIITKIKEKQLKTLTNISDQNPNNTNPNNNTSANPITPEELFNKMLHAAYIRKEDNYYTTIFSIKNGVIRMNAWEVGNLHPSIKTN